MLNLNPTKRKEKRQPNNFQVIDLETSNWTNFIVGGYYDGKNYFEYQDLKTIVDFINNSEKQLKIFAHFGGGFDFLFLIEQFFEHGVIIESVIPRGSMILSIKIKGKYKTHVLRDSAALLPFSLDSLTKNFNVPTKKGIYDHSLNRGYNQELSEYLKSDCIGLYQVLEAFYSSEIIAAAGPASTIASQAQRVLQNYLPKQIKGIHEQTNEFMRNACHGGRTEIFKPLGKNLYEYDVNSLYPYVMKNFQYPAGLAIKCYYLKEDRLGIYEVIVHAPKDLHIPIIPTKVDKKLIFPLGTFKTTCTSVEIEYAKTLGYKFEIIKGYYFREKEYYFKEFIDALYAIRQKAEKNSVDNILSKLIMNSSYGKFIIKLKKTNLSFELNSESKLFREVKIKGKLYEIYQNDVVLNSFNHCGIGAFILAYARIHMHKLMHPIAPHVYYTDTDSIWTDLVLPSSNELGELKLEKPKGSTKDFYENACFLLPKTYIAQNSDYKKIAMKGFDSRKIKHLNYSDFVLAYQGELKLSVTHDESIAKFKTALKYMKVVTLKNKQTKTIKAKYSKRILDIKNNISYPIFLSN